MTDRPKHYSRPHLRNFLLTLPANAPLPENVIAACMYYQRFPKLRAFLADPFLYQRLRDMTVKRAIDLIDDQILEGRT